MEALGIAVIERLIAPKVGLTEEDTVDKRINIVRRALEIGKNTR